MIDVAASLSAGVATAPPDNLKNYTPPSGFSLLPGLTGLPGSNRVYDLTAALFNSFTPTQPVLGLLTVETSQATPLATGGLQLTHQFSTVSEKAFTQNGTFTPIPNPTDPQLGNAMGSIDNSLGVNTVGTNPKNPSLPVPNSVRLYGPISLTPRGTITLDYPNQLSDLSESFRPDLAGTAIVDVQGDIQSFRGLSANGLVLNDTGNLNLLKTGMISNSTIIAQPLTHIQAPMSSRSNVLIITSSAFPFVGKRHPDLTIIPSLRQIGPLSQPNNSPNP
jgi:hypothetical protein